MGTQALNGHYNVHDVISTHPATGSKIAGRLSDFKTPETAHLWKDDHVESPRREKERKAVERKTGVVRHNRIIPPLIPNEEYKLLKDAVAIVGGHVSTLRDWIKKGEIKNFKKEERKGGVKFLIDMKELTELIRKKRGIQADGTQTWEQKNRAARRAYSLAYYHKNKKLKFIREVKSESI